MAIKRTPLTKPVKPVVRKNINQRLVPKSTSLLDDKGKVLSTIKKETG
jgi:hypothetical protein